MTKQYLPALWLITIIVALPQLSETIYTPSLPDIAHSLAVSESAVEYTLTIFLAGFAFGTLFWGNISDKFGRKPCLLLGLVVFILGCIGCYYSNSIEWLMFSRFIQAFGGSTGSVLGQAITRDAFQGKERGKVYANVGSALSFSPAIGPIIGGFTDQFFGWQAIFLLLIVLGMMVFTASAWRLPETHPTPGRHLNILKLASKVLTDRHVLGYGLLVGGCHGINFSYYGEGSFYLIQMLGLSPSSYGTTFILIAAAGFLGGQLSRKLLDRFAPQQIIEYALKTIIFSAVLFLGLTFALEAIQAPPAANIMITLLSMVIMSVGFAMVTGNALAVALEHYQYAVGTASAIFGFFYYIVISLFTFGMGLLHNDTLVMMPTYFLFIAIFMFFTLKIMIQRSISEEPTSSESGL